MYRLVLTKPLPPIFKFAEKNKIFRKIVPLLVLGILLSAPSAGARETINTAPDETFTVELDRESSFLRWSLTDFDPTRLSRFEVQRGDITGPDQFTFRAIEPGTTELQFTLEQTTVFGTEIMDTRVFRVNIGLEYQSSSDRSQPTIGGDSPEVSEDVIRRLREEKSAPAPQKNRSSGSSRNSRKTDKPSSEEWNRLLELMELERYEQARELINQQREELKGEERFRWLNQRAESFRRQGEFDQAVEAWNQMIEDFPRGPIPRWRLSLAKTHREAGQDDQAVLELLKIRHRHKRHSVWPDAMIMLGEIATRRGNFERARNLLEGARRSLESRDPPRLLLQLARLYDRNEPIRDYERAVNLYEDASQALENTEPELAKQARQRAQYLNDNYVQFGFD